MTHHVLQPDARVYEERPGHEGQEPRLTADLTGALDLRQSRARISRYPPHTRGRRHIDSGQEEVFVVLAGTLTVLLGDPPECVDVAPGGAVSVESGTALQLRNESDAEVVVFAYGAPPVTGTATFVDDVPDL